MVTKETECPPNNINDEVEAFKSLAYAMKDQAGHLDRNVNGKLLRALRSHEKRIVRLEKILNAQAKQKELEDVS